MNQRVEEEPAQSTWFERFKSNLAALWAAVSGWFERTFSRIGTQPEITIDTGLGWREQMVDAAIAYERQGVPVVVPEYRDAVKRICAGERSEEVAEAARIFELMREQVGDERADALCASLGVPVTGRSPSGRK